MSDRLSQRDPFPGDPGPSSYRGSYAKPVRTYRPSDLIGLVLNAIGYALVGVATLALCLVLAFPLILLAAWAVTPLITLAGAIL